MRMRMDSIALAFLLTLMVTGLNVRPATALFLDRKIVESVPKQLPPREILHSIPHAQPGEKVVSSGLTQSQLIKLGRFIFNNETFQGNGRTCATCHPAKNNFTIDPQYIATLPPHNPLFVAETNPDLVNLENPVLLRDLGLICENLDGFDEPCVFRSVPHLLALSTSTTPPLEDPPSSGNVIVPGTEVRLANSTGWSGDGAPIGDGTRGELRLFALGAIVQHFPKTLNRVPGVDYRVPSDLELDALLAYQLSLGRQRDLELDALTFKNPVVETGKLFFQDQDLINGGRCSLCHHNAGANRPPDDPNAGRNTFANTRVELTAFPPAYLLQPDDIAVDGGFGKPPVLSPTVPDRPGARPGFGDGRFDTPTIIEAAATPPYFHNNSVATLEAAVAFYASPEFNTDPSDPIILLNTDKSTAIAAFLRAVGAMELIDRSITNDLSAMESGPPSGKSKDLEVKESVGIALANSWDAIKVLKEGVYSLYPDAQGELARARALQKMALGTDCLSTRNVLLEKANTKLSHAKGMIVEIGGITSDSKALTGPSAQEEVLTDVAGSITLSVEEPPSQLGPDLGVPGQDAPVVLALGSVQDDRKGTVEGNGVPENTGGNTTKNVNDTQTPEGSIVEPKPVLPVQKAVSPDPPVVWPAVEPYSVHVGSYKAQKGAEEEVSELKKTNYESFALPAEISGRGTWYRVFVGTFKDRASAQSYCNELKKKGFPGDIHVADRSWGLGK